MTKRITDLPQATEITAGKQLPIDDLITERATIQQIADFVLAQIPDPEPVGGGGSPITAVMQNVQNEKGKIIPIQIENSAWDSYTHNRNIIYTLAGNYSEGATSIELTCVYPSATFKPIYPCRIIIYDGTNKSYATLTGFTAGTNYTLAAALVNQNNAQVAYSTDTAVIRAKMKTRNVRNGEASPPSGTTGQAASAPEDLLVKYLQNTITAGKVTAFRNFISESFVIVGKPTSVTTEITSATDKSAVFPSGTKFLVYYMKDNGSFIESIENGTFEKNFSIFVTSDVATHGSGKITLTHSSKTNTGIETDGTYYVIKLPTTKILVEDKANAGTPAEVLPGKFLVKDDGIPYPAGLVCYLDFDNLGVDRIGTQNFTIGSGLTLATGKFRNGYTSFAANVNNKIYTGGLNAALATPASTPFAYEFWVKLDASNTDGYLLDNWDNNASNGYWAKMWYTGANTMHFGYGTGAGQGLSVTVTGYEDGNFHHIVYVYDGSTTGYVYIDGALVASGAVGNYHYESEGWITLGLYGYNNTMPLVGVISEFGMWKTTIPTETQITQRYANGIGRKFGILNNFSALYELEEQTGNKVTVSTITEIASAANELDAKDLGVGFIIQ